MMSNNPTTNFAINSIILIVQEDANTLAGIRPH
jgi:hypothetical protein